MQDLNSFEDRVSTEEQNRLEIASGPEVNETAGRQLPCYKSRCTRFASINVAEIIRIRAESKVNLAHVLNTLSYNSAEDVCRLPTGGNCGLT